MSLRVFGLRLAKLNNAVFLTTVSVCRLRYVAGDTKKKNGDENREKRKEGSKKHS